MSKIQWTDETWNCITGCTKTSKGCAKCYASSMSKRLQGMYKARLARGDDIPDGIRKYQYGFDKVVCHYNELLFPSTLLEGKRVFANSMSDTFHKDVPIAFIMTMFFVMKEANQHQYQLLTKRAGRLSRLDIEGHLDWQSNIWMGVSVERKDYKYRIDHLRSTGARIKFISFEPLLGDMGTLNLKGISQAIVGCETGPRARYMNPQWARDIRDQCREQGVKFFMKAVSNKESIPDDLMIREFPEEAR